MKHFLLTTCFLVAGSSATAEVRYQIVDLSVVGKPSQYPDSLSINSAGQVAGPGGVWSPNTGLTPLPFSPLGINDLGQVIGTAVDASERDNAYLWTPGPTVNDPGTIQNLGLGYPTGINNGGTVVGDFYVGQDGYRPWRWTAEGGRQPLTLEFQNVRAGTIDINNAGTIIGLNYSGAYIYTWDDQSPMGDEFLHPEGQAYGWDLNNVGQIAGQGPDNAAMLYTPGTGFQSLGRLNDTQGWASGLNDAGQVVGITTFDLDDDLGTAWIWSAAEGIVDLNTLIPPQDPDGWFLRNAWGINNAGQIVGTARFGGEESVVFLLNPVPEPPALVLAMTGLASLGTLRVFRRSPRGGISGKARLVALRRRDPRR